MSNICIIPARGGSKRIPKKNIKDFLGKPIIAYSIETALKSGLFEEVMVSTDSLEISNIAQEYGAKVPFLRRETNSNDFATTADVINEVVHEYKSRNKYFDTICCLYATAPFVTPSRLIEAASLLEKNKFKTVLPVVKYSFPIQRALVLNSSNRLTFNQPEHQLSRSQDLVSTYHDSGQFYWLDTKIFIETNQIWTDNTGAIILKDMEAHDIDTYEDWALAELKFKINHEHKT